ncbi:MAG TPA: GNAT family protein [Ktedonobacterales bacterium]
MANENTIQGASGETEPVYNIVGAKVALGPGTREENIREFYRAENDFGTAILSGDPMRPRERARYEADYDRYSKESHPDWVSFIIYDRATGTAIGGLGLRHIDLAKGLAEVGIIITRKDYWGGGYGTEALTLVLDYGFTVLGLHNVLLETYAYNERALRSYRKVGFKEIGRRRQAQRIGDKRYDTVFMDILRTEFQSPFPPVVPLP